MTYIVIVDARDETSKPMDGSIYFLQDLYGSPLEFDTFDEAEKAVTSDKNLAGKAFRYVDMDN